MFTKSHEKSPPHNSAKNNTAQLFVPQLLECIIRLTPAILHELLLFLQYVFSEEVLQLPNSTGQREETLWDLSNI